jgi:hypothetical protein
MQRFARLVRIVGAADRQSQIHCHYYIVPLIFFKSFFSFYESFPSLLLPATIFRAGAGAGRG